MAIWTDSASGQWTDSSTGLWTDEDIEGGEVVAVEDARLDLAAYAQAVEDAGLDASAYYQSMEDLAAALQMIGWSVEDVRSYLSATAPIVEDATAYLSTIGQAQENMLSALQAVGWARSDLGSYLEAHSGTVLSDLGVCLDVTDGLAFSNAPAWLCAIRQAPAFRSTVAQRAASVVYQATWSTVEDAGVFLQVASIARDDLGLSLEAVAS